MGKPLMLQEADAERIEALKKRLRARTKIEVVRSALALLERNAERTARVARWRRAAGLVATQSRIVLRDFQRHSRLRRVD
jgi:NAD(P)H-nitrite reductase large subunit